MDALPIVYCRGYAGPTSNIDSTVDDPFYGFNEGATHTRVDGDGDPRFYQFEGPLLRLMGEHDYKLLVRGSQAELLADAVDASLDPKTIWVSRFYDVAATTFVPDPTEHENPVERFIDRVKHGIHDHLTADGFDIERAATELYNLITTVIDKTEGHPKVNLVAHSMGGLVARCMMQKICETPDEHGNPRRHATDIVARLFTYATPHGGINFTGGLLNWAMETFGPDGSQIFSPPKMYGYLTKGAKFGDTPPAGLTPPWDPRIIPADIFDTDNVFCLIGTDQQDYGISKDLVGPQSDGLVQIQNAYVKNAHRAFVYKSHSGRYGEVNSEEGYQNLARFLFGTWAVKVELSGMPHRDDLANGVAWQADMRLAIRGLSVLMTEQTAAHYCPIQLNEVRDPSATDSIDTPVPLVGTFLLQKEPPDDLGPTLVAEDGDATTPADAPAPALAATSDQLSRYALSLKVYQVETSRRTGAFDFSDHLEQVGDWNDVLIVDVGRPSPDAPFGVWTGWNTEVAGPIAERAQMPNLLDLPQQANGAVRVGRVPLPQRALTLPIFDGNTELLITISERG
ncbi:esterase/lipase family protein [Leifsonia sp. SIMBA_070]|uniref:esterase/lipase family protein n=1 Tax=Leifsonia sp. SIMBA_070 TaxID=3085810 RepID=UPI00397912C2